MANTEKKENGDLLTRMSSVVSHEIRNPLAVISNSLYFIKTKLGTSGAELDPKIAKHIGIIEGEVKHSNEVIDEMLAFTRRRELQLVPLHLNSAMDELSGSFPLPPGVALKKVPCAGDPRVSADIETMRYAMRQAMINSVQAMPEGGTLTLACSQDDAMAHLSITDSGPGFPDGDGEKAFEPFFTTRPRGVGLGLTIVRQYMERHGGAASAVNVPGGGARVTLSLPLLK